MRRNSIFLLFHSTTCARPQTFPGYSFVASFNHAPHYASCKCLRFARTNNCSKPCVSCNVWPERPCARRVHHRRRHNPLPRCSAVLWAHDALLEWHRWWKIIYCTFSIYCGPEILQVPPHAFVCLAAAWNGRFEGFGATGPARF